MLNVMDRGERTVPQRVFARYVAIGDSSTEGLDDPDGRGGYRGWANRLAEALAAAQASPLLYANLGVRGRSTRQIRDEQLEPAAAMRPDLVTLFRAPTMWSHGASTPAGWRATSNTCNAD